MDSDNVRLLIDVAIEHLDGISLNCQGASICDGDVNGAHEHNYGLALEAIQQLTEARQALASTEAQTADPADELEATIKTDRVANVRYYYSMETFAVTLRDGRQGQGLTIRAAIDSANQRKA